MSALLSDTGYPGAVRSKDLKPGWAQVTYFVRPYDDETTEYVGPLLEENTDYIVIEVFDEPMTFPKSRVIVDRAAEEPEEEPS